METRQTTTSAIVEQSRNVYQGMSQARRVAAAGAGVGVLSSVLPWYSVSSSIPGYNASASINGWHGWGLLVLLAFIVAGALALFPVLGAQTRALLPNLALRLGDARLTGGLGAVAIVATFAFMHTEGSGVSYPGLSEGLSFGADLGLLAALAVVAGGMMLGREGR